MLEVLDNFVGCLDYWGIFWHRLPGDTHRTVTRHSDRPTDLKTRESSVDLSRHTFEKFPPKTSPGDGGVFFFKRFFFKTQLQHPKDDENPWEILEDGGLCVCPLGEWLGLAARQEIKEKEERLKRVPLGEKHVVTCNWWKLQWNTYVKTPRIARMSLWKISCSWIFEPNYLLFPFWRHSWRWFSFS